MLEQAKTVHANTFFMYLKAHSYHWNVEGVNFPQLHSFFGDLYDELFDAVDPLAENIRKLGSYAPRNIEEMYASKTIDCLNSASTWNEMVSDLLQANNEVIDSLNKLFGELSAANEQGFANFIADRLDQHKKHGWMLRSILKSNEE